MFEADPHLPAKANDTDPGSEHLLPSSLDLREQIREMLGRNLGHVAQLPEATEKPTDDSELPSGS